MTLPSDAMMFRGACAVVHIRAATTLALCQGSFAASNVTAVYPPDVPTCFWCITDREGHGLRWFAWGT